MSSSRTAALLAWCAHNHIQIDARLRIADNQHSVDDPDEPCTRGLSVHSREEQIECACTLVYIPKTAVLSVKSCFLSQYISSVPYGHGAHLSLALALYGELLLGPLSRWFGYLQSLPQETVDIAMFWGVNDAVEARPCTCSARGCSNTDNTPGAVDGCQRPTATSTCPSCIWLHDNQNAREWLQVTEVDQQQVGLMEEVRQYYLDVVEPTFHAASTNPGLEHDLSYIKRGPAGDPNPRVSFPGFCYPYSLVSTRAFWVDAYHGLAMVPIADVFNHTNDNHVQMESDYDVCVECGSLAECVHDRETVAAPLPQEASGIDYLEMRTVRPILPGSEVFNTYGSLSNAALLARYGFTLAENEHDTVRMESDPSCTMRLLLRSVGVAEAPVGEDDLAITEASVFGRFAVRNTFRVGDLADHGADSDPCDKEQQPYGQGIAANDTPIDVDEPCASTSSDVSDEPANIIHRVFTHVAGLWRSDAAWDDQGDGLVFNPPGRDSLLAGDTSVRMRHGMAINADGQVSHTLWLFCMLVALFAARSHLGASFGDLIERVERGPEALISRAEFKARLISVQGWAERLCHMHDGDRDGDTEGGGNQGSTSSPPLPHLALQLDYDSEPDEFAQRAQAQSGRANPAALESSERLGPPLGTGGDPEMSTTAQAPPVRQATTRTRRRRSAERAWPSKRVRRCSDAMVAEENSGCVDRLGTRARHRAVLDACDDEVLQTADATRAALLLARIVVGLCRDRYRAPTLRGVGMTAAELGDVLDETPECMRRTRCALRLAIGERSVVESCAARWGAVLGDEGRVAGSIGGSGGREEMSLCLAGIPAAHPGLLGSVGC